MKKAMILGSSGLIGMSLLSNLLQDPEYTEVIALVRKKQLIQHPKLQQVVVNFDSLADYASYFEVQDVFCCLGTTMKKAKSKDNFRQVDYNYPLEAAKMASVKGVQRFLLVSAIGADPQSRFFYNRVKGDVEQEISEQKIPGIFIFRPSLLLGARREFRIGEKLTAWLSKPLSLLLVGPIQKYRPIEAKLVADAMHKAAQSNEQGVLIFESGQMQ